MVYSRTTYFSQSSSEEYETSRAEESVDLDWVVDEMRANCSADCGLYAYLGGSGMVVGCPERRWSTFKDAADQEALCGRLQWGAHQLVCETAEIVAEVAEPSLVD